MNTKENIFYNFMGGKFYENKSDKLIDIKSPLDGSLVGRIQSLSKEDVDKIIDNAEKAQKSWNEVPLNERAHVLYKTADLLEEHKEELANIMIREVAKDKKSALSGFNRSKISVVTREPLGVVLAISPFNYPVNLSASKIAPAIVAGNSVVLKPATQGSLSALFLAKMFHDAGLPGGVLNTVTGRGSEIGDYCVTHDKIDFINFTGSTEVGRRISEITVMKPLLMELGGKDAAIVLEDADLDLTVNNIIAGGYSYSGQRCTAVKRILVMNSVADKLVEKLKEKISKLKMGNPLEVEDVTIVPLIDNKAADFVMELIDDAKEKGATLVCGGHREGNLIEATLFDNVTTDMRLAWEEPFGPVLPIIRINDKDEAIKIANASKYGLQSSVFTRDINEAFYIANKLEVGTVHVNNKTERGPDHFPFLGVKSSGMGTQGIRYSIEAMSRPKATVITIR